MEPLIIILGLSILLNIVLGFLHLGKIKDADKDFIPDAIEDKAIKVKEQTMHRLGRIKEELADVFLYLIQISDKLGIDILECATKKIDLNAQKYPVSLSKGKATKYNKL